jgi:peptidylprolyl isomerase
MKRFSILLFTIIALGVIMTSGCAVPVAKNGDTVQVDYTGKLTDGTVFDSSVGKEPLKFVLGDGQMIPGFDKAVLGMKAGEKKTFTIPAAEAYGPYDARLVKEISTKQLPAGMTVEVGQQLQSTQNGNTVVVTVTKVVGDNITIDANHPLAGKDLIFNIELLKIL